MKLGEDDGSYPRRILCSLNIESIDWRILSSSVSVQVDCAIPSAATIVLSVVIGHGYIVFFKPRINTADPRRCIVNVAVAGVVWGFQITFSDVRAYRRSHSVRFQT